MSLYTIQMEVLIDKLADWYNIDCMSAIKCCEILDTSNELLRKVRERYWEIRKIPGGESLQYKIDTKIRVGKVNEADLQWSQTLGYFKEYIITDMNEKVQQGDQFLYRNLWEDMFLNQVGKTFKECIECDDKLKSTQFRRKVKLKIEEEK